MINIVYLYISTSRSTCAVPRYFGQMFSELFQDWSSPLLLVSLWFYIKHTLYFYCIIIIIIIINRFPPESSGYTWIYANDLRHFNVCTLHETRSLLVVVLGLFAKLPKETIRCVMSVCLSVCSPACETQHPPGDFLKFYIGVSVEILSRKFEFHYNPTRITGALHEHLRKFTIISRSTLLRMRNVLEKIVEKTKTQFYFLLLSFENRAVYQIMWKNMAETDRPQIRIYYGACALQLTKVTDSHSEYVIVTAFPRQKWLCECASMLRLCIHFLPLYYYCCRGSKACHSSMEITGLLIPIREVLDFPLFHGSPSFFNCLF